MLVKPIRTSLLMRAKTSDFSIIISESFPQRTYSSKHADCKVHIFYDNERRKDLIENYYIQNQDENGNLPKNLQTTVYGDTKLFGVTFLLTNIDNKPELIYKDYKTRWAIEEMFDTQKNTLGFK